jgi:hypothetical protein
MNVGDAGMPVCAQNARSAGDAPVRITPLPVRTMGRRALRMIAAASRTAASSGRLAAGTLDPRGRIRAGSSAAAIVSDSSRCVGPGRSACASLKALRTTSGTVSGRSMRAFHFVTGRSMSTTSTYWWLSLWTRSSFTWPVIATMGA